MEYTQQYYQNGVRLTEKKGFLYCSIYVRNLALSDSPWGDNHNAAAKETKRK